MRVVWRCQSAGWGRAHRAAAVLRRWPNDDDELHLAQFPHVAAPVERLGLRSGDARDVELLASADLLVLDGPLAPALAARFQAPQVAHMLRYGDPVPDRPGARFHVEREAGDGFWPLLLLDPAECLDRAAARAALGLPADARLVLVVECRLPGSPALTPRCEGVDATVVRLPVEAYPAQRYLAAADVVVGAAGGRLRDECEAAGVAHVLIPLGAEQAVRSRYRLADLPAVLADVAPAAPPPPNRAAALAAALHGVGKTML